MRVWSMQTVQIVHQVKNVITLATQQKQMVNIGVLHHKLVLMHSACRVVQFTPEEMARHTGRVMLPGSVNVEIPLSMQHVIA